MSIRSFIRARGACRASQRGNCHTPRVTVRQPLAAAAGAGRVRRALATVALCGLVLAAMPRAGSGFTQSGVGTVFGNLVPMGHEWITRLAALELLGGDPVLRPDPDDPRRVWSRGRAKNPDISDPNAQREAARIRSLPAADPRYQSAYQFVLDAIVGQRWADIGGFNVTTSRLGPIDCHDAVTQQPAEIQYDHFMRRYDDRDAAGGIAAARRSRDRFVEYFVTAAMAPAASMIVWDGGGVSAQAKVDRNYFLLGRAVHLLQDSFSSEHTVRVPDDNHERVIQVKGYLCPAGAEQHSRSTQAIFDYTSGDVIWRPGTRIDVGWPSYKPSNMKVLPLVATEATKDLWAAFIRTMGRPIEQREQAARSEAARLAANWLRMDEAEAATWYDDESHRDSSYVLASGQTGKGREVAQCMRDLGVPSGDQLARVRELEQQRRICLYNTVAATGYSDLFDRSLRLWFNWSWRDQFNWLTPPDGWPIPDLQADTGARVRIKSVANGQPMAAPDGIANNAWVYCRAGARPLDLIRVGSRNEAYFRVAEAPNLFLSYTAVTGAVKLYSSPQDAGFRLQDAGEGYSIQNLTWKQYMWLSGESPYVTRSGDPSNRNSRWWIEGLP